MTLTYTPSPDLGNPLPQFSLLGADEKEYSDTDFSSAKVLVVIFTCNHCPYAQAARPRLIALHDLYEDYGVQFIAINSNDDISYPEDSFEDMKEERYNYPFPYLKDDSQEVARVFGAVCTPDIFVYDSDQKLVYRGRIDDNWQDETAVTSEDLRDAIEALIDGEKPSTKQPPSMGCSIKWKD